MTACVRCDYFATGPSQLDTIMLHKAVIVKIPVGGTNLGSVEDRIVIKYIHSEYVSYICLANYGASEAVYLCYVVRKILQPALHLKCANIFRE
jgi:hypothetical protein